MRIENYVGSGILLAAVTHLALTLPERNVFGLYDYVVPGQTLVRIPLQVIGGYRVPLMNLCLSVIPAKAGIQGQRAFRLALDSLSSQTKCNTCLRCCDGKAI